MCKQRCRLSLNQYKIVNALFKFLFDALFCFYLIYKCTYLIEKMKYAHK